MLGISWVWWVLIIIVLAIGMVVRYYQEKDTPIMGSDGIHSDILVVCLDATDQGAEFCQHVMSQTMNPERVRIGLIQRRVNPSQNVVTRLNQWGRQDILNRTRITLVDDEATLMQIMLEIYKHLYDDEPRILMMLPNMRLVKHWDTLATPLTLQAVHTAAMVRPDYSADKPAFPIVSETIHGVPAFALQNTTDHEDEITGMVRIPMTAVMSNCMVLSRSAFEQIVARSQNVVVPDWAFSAVISSIVFDAGFPIVNCSYILGHMDLAAPERLPVNGAWKQDDVKQMLSPRWMSYAGVHSPRGKLGVSESEHELEWRWKWGDHNSQDAARDRAGYLDD